MRAWRLLLWSTLAALLAALLVALLLLTNSLGARMSLSLLSNVLSDVELEYHQGTLWQGVTLKRFTLNTAALQIDSDQLAIKLHLPCLLQKTLCIDEFSIGHASIVIDTLRLKVENFSTTARLSSERVSLNLPRAENLQLIIIENNSSADISAESNEPTEFILPFELDISGLGLQQADLVLADTSIILSDVELDASWQTRHVNLKLASVLEQFELWPEINHSQLSLDLSGSLKQMHFLLQSEGALTGQAEGEVEPLSAALPFSVELAVRSLPLPEALNSVLQVSALDLTAAGDLTQQQLELELALKGIGNNFAGNAGLLTGKVSHQQQTLIFDELEFIDQQQGGELSAAGSFSYQGGLQWQAGINLNNFFLPDFLPAQGQLSGQFNSQGHFTADAWQFSLSDTDLQGQINQLPAVLRGDFSLNNLWQIPAGNVHLELNDLLLDLQGSSDEQWHVEGVLTAASLNQWYSAANGQGQLQLSINGALGDPEVKLDGYVKGLSWQQLSVPELEVALHYQPAQNHLGSLNLSADSLYYAEGEVNALQLSVTGDLSEQHLQWSSKGELDTDMRLSGRWLEQQRRWQGRLASAQFAYGQFNWQLQEALELWFDVDNSALSLSPHCWQGQQNQFCLLEQAELGSSGYLNMSVNADLAVIDEFVLPDNLQIDTRLAGELALAWQPGLPPELDAQLNVSAGQILVVEQDELVPVINWQAGQININSDTEQASFSLSLDQQEQPLMNVELQLFDQWGSIKGQVSLNNISLQPLVAFMPQLAGVAGSFNADLLLSGSLQTPAVNGGLWLDDAEVTLLSSPRVIEELTLEANFNGHDADFNGGFVLADEPLSITGQAAWADQLQLEAHVFADVLNVLFPPELMATIKPDLFLSLDERKLSLSGDIEVLSGQIKLTDVPEGSVSPSSDQIFVDNAGVPIEQQQGFAIETDVNVLINESFAVEGMGFNGHLGGRLQVLQKQNQPLQLFGSMQILDGRYRAYGQRLEVERGEVSFNGPVNNPHVNLRAVRKISRENISAGIQLMGLTDNLVLSFFSEPAMPQSDVMSYLLRGRAADAEVESSSMLTMVINSGLSNNQGIFKELERSSFISNIAVDTEGSGSETQATISGYLGERVYLKYGKGLYEPINEVTVQLYILSRLWVETVSGLERSADLYYSFDIE